MRSIFRYAILIILISFAVLNLQLVNAQTTCTLKGLTTTDCQLIADAGTNLATMQTFNMDYNVSFKASGLQSGNITFSSHGTGPVDVSGMNDTDLATFLGQLVFATKTTSTLTSGATTLNGALEVRMVNSFVYMNSDLYTQSKWQKFDVVKFFNALLNQRQGQFQTYDLSAISFDMLKALENNGFADIPNAYQAKSQPGKTIDGQATTQIVIDYNLYNFLTYLFATQNHDTARSILGGIGQSITDAQFTQYAALLPLFKTTLQATKLEQTWSIGTQDKLYHGLGLTFSTKIDPTTLSLLGQSSTQAITSSGSLAVTFTKIGKPVTVQAVNTATDITDDVLAQFPNSSSASSTGGDSGGTAGSGSGSQPAPEAVIPDDATTLYADLKTGTSADGFATLGDPKAPVQIVQYSSYSCSFCQDYYNSKIVPILDEIKSGNVYYTFVPVTLTGEFDSTPETKAAYCALQQGKYWEMHDVLFDWQTRYGSASADVDRLSAGAKGLDMNVSKFNSCVKSSKADQFVQAANDNFNQQNLTGTPSILINGTLFHPAADGATEPDLRAYIDQLASGGGEATPSASGN